MEDIIPKTKNYLCLTSDLGSVKFGTKSLKVSITKVLKSIKSLKRFLRLFETFEIETLILLVPNFTEPFKNT